MWPDRRLTDLFDIEHPLVLAPMAGLGTATLAAAVCAGGGLGSISCANLSPQLAATAICELQALTDKAINVNSGFPTAAGRVSGPAGQGGAAWEQRLHAAVVGEPVSSIGM